MSVAEILGYTAAILTTGSFFPQAIRVVRTRDTRAISLTMYAMFTVGVSLWLVYGVITAQWSITLANAVTVALAAVILAMKVRDVLGLRSRAG